MPVQQLRHAVAEVRAKREPGRDRVIEYVAERYGRDRVSQIITYGTMAAKAVVRDVARVLGRSYGCEAGTLLVSNRGHSVSESGDATFV